MFSIIGFIIFLLISTIVYLLILKQKAEDKLHPQPTVVQKQIYPTPWKCSSTVDNVNMVPSRVNANHMVECLGDGVSCAWTKKLSECNASIANEKNLKVYGELYTEPDITIVNDDWHYNTLKTAGITKY